MLYDRQTNGELTRNLARLQRRKLAAASHQAGDDADLRRLVHDLQVHQIELEMQNRELRKTKVELESSRNRYADLYDFAPVGYVDFDHRGVVRQINLTGAELLGRVRSRVVGKPFTLYLSAAHAVRFCHHLRHCWKSGQKETAEIEVRVKNGAVPLQISTIAVESSETGERVCRSILVDVTQNQRAAEALRQSEERYRILTESMPQFVWTAWPDGRVDYVNAWFTQYTGLRIAEAPRNCWIDAVHPDDLRGLRGQQLAPGRETEPAQPDGRFRRASDGAYRWHLARLFALRDAKGALTKWIASAIDIDDRKRLEIERKETEAQIRAAHDQLEARVVERTAELAQAVSALEQEAVERKQAQDARDKLFRELVTAQEQERSRISRELHDEMGQHMAALLLGLKTLEVALKEKPQMQQLRDLQNLSDEIGKQIHRIAVELRPTALDDLGLHATLLNYLDEWSERFGITVDFHSGAVENERLPGELETTIYLIIQEGLTTVVKQAQATRLSLILLRKEDDVLTILEDNGKVFDADLV